MRILIAEDEADIRDVLRAMLVEAGHQVSLAGTFNSAARLLDMAEYDLMLTDMVMPGGNGIALAHAARARGMAAVLCTGHPDEGNALEHAGIDYLQKPFSMKALLTKIENAGRSVHPATVDGA
jgi:DNA-binding response OmpR family regulator